MNKIRKAVTLIEVMIIISIIALIAAITIPSFLQVRSWTQPGQYRMWHNHRVYVVTEDYKTSPQTYIVRTEDNKEIHVNSDELSPDTAVEKQ